MICIMKKWITFAGLLGVASGSAAMTEDPGVVNERPPLSRTELEAHWGVDCTALAARLAAWTGEHGAEPQWLEEARLCAAIHNAPGDREASRCPDFAAVRATLAGTLAPQQQRESIGRLLQCAH
jgi:hypothetical protein